MSNRAPRGQSRPRTRTQGAAMLAAEQAAQRRRDRRRLVAMLVVAVVLVVGVGVGLPAWRASRSPQAVPPGSSAETSQTVVDGEPLRLGLPDAPVTVTLYEDVHCPHCADFEDELGPVLTAAQDAGRVRIEVYPLSFRGEGSTRAANALACAAESGFAERYHRGLFANATLAWSEQQLLELGALSAAEGSDVFRTCVSGGAHLGWVDSITAAAAADGVTQTPTVLLDGAPVDVQTLTPASLQTLIDAKA